jgi:predicted DsbA family dithiol-disulfide isomerase
MKKLLVEIWSDVACPWCYVGKRRFEAALANFPHRAAVEVRWRSFELDRSAPRVLDGSILYAARIAKKYGVPVAKAEQMIATMTNTAAQEGLDFHFEKIRPGNTFDAHRVLHLAAVHEKGDRAKERFLRAYFTEGEPIGEPEVLVRLGGEVGLDRDEVRATVAGDRFASEVRADEAEAEAAGIHGVPFFVIGGRYGVSGAQPPEKLLEVLSYAWEQVSEDQTPSEGAVCGPDGCA